MLAARPLFDLIGATYDATRRAEPDLVNRLRELLDQQPHSSILDIGCGTGNYTTALLSLGYQVVGLDLSVPMLKQARHKSLSLPLAGGNAGALPFRDRSFTGAICTLAIHHFDDLKSAFAEARRVLNGGKLVIFTALPEQISRYWLNAYFPHMIKSSASTMPNWPAVEGALRRAGFRTWQHAPYWMPKNPIDNFLYCGKHQPSLYLDARVRANISAFANLGDTQELAEGLHRLRRDIDTGQFAKVAASYDDSAGDYLFVTAQS